MKLSLALLVAPVAAFAPTKALPKAATVVYADGKYDGQMWDMAAKKDVWSAWDPNSPRAETNFNPRRPASDAFPSRLGPAPPRARRSQPAAPLAGSSATPTATPATAPATSPARASTRTPSARTSTSRR